MSKLIENFVSKDSINQPLLIKGVLKGATDKGAPYLTITLQDKSGSIHAKLWNVNSSEEEIAKVGKVVLITGDVIEYNNALQLRIRSISPLNQESVSMDDFVMTADISKEALKKKINTAISSINNINYRNMVIKIYEKVGDDFYDYPAAARIHHSFLGGLAVHITDMVKLGNVICELYPQLNSDLLIAGILTHDIGKMIEFSGPITTEYTLEGKLTGHISIMHGKLMEVSKELNIEDSEEAILLRHMVLSHHGQYEYGSPVLPQLQEAEVLYIIDNLDARLNTLETALKQTKPGFFTPRIFSLENRSFYKPKK